MNDHEPAWVHDVLQYWFEELPEAAWFKINLRQATGQRRCLRAS